MRVFQAVRSEVALSSMSFGIGVNSRVALPSAITLFKDEKAKEKMIVKTARISEMSIGGSMLIVALSWVTAMGAEKNLIATHGDSARSAGDFEPGVSGYIDMGLNAFKYFKIDETTASREGGRSLLCLPCDSNQVSLRKIGGLPLDPEKRYKLTVAMKSQDVEFGKCGVFIINEGWTWCAHPSDPKSPSSDWADYSVTFQPKPSSNKSYKLVITPPAKGKLWIDNIRVEEESVAGAKAEKAQKEQAVKDKTQSPK